MSHFDFTRPGGQWANEMVPGAADFQRLDVKQSKLVNDSAGGTWNPTNPICIGGAGMALTTGSSGLSGGVECRGQSTIEHALGDITQLRPARTRSITLSLLELIDVSQAIGQNTLGGSSYQLLLDQYLTISTNPTGIKFTGAVNAELSVPGRYLHHGGTSKIASVSLTFRVLNRPATLPGTLASFGLVGLPTSPTPAPSSYSTWSSIVSFPPGVYAIPRNNKTEPLSYFLSGGGISGASEPTWNTTPGATTTDGSITWTCIGQAGLFFAATVDDYYNAGLPQTLTCAYDTSTGGATLNNATNRYGLVWTNWPTDGSILLHSVQANFVNISSMDFE